MASEEDGDVEAYLLALAREVEEEKAAKGGAAVGSKRTAEAEAGADGVEAPATKLQKTEEEVIQRGPVRTMAAGPLPSSLPPAGAAVSPSLSGASGVTGATETVSGGVTASVTGSEVSGGVPQLSAAAAAAVPARRLFAQLPTRAEVQLPLGYVPTGRTRLLPVVSDTIRILTPQERLKQEQEKAQAEAIPSTVFKLSKAGQDWVDETLAEWDEDDYRIFVGNLGPDISDDLLKQAFMKYPSFKKAKVIYDKKSKKPKGYGFVSMGDPDDYLSAIRDMQGKYVGNRPVQLKKSKWKDRVVKKVKRKEPK